MIHEDGIGTTLLHLSTNIDVDRNTPQTHHHAGGASGIANYLENTISGRDKDVGNMRLRSVNTTDRSACTTNRRHSEIRAIDCISKYFGGTHCHA